MTGPWILWFDDLGITDVPRLGGKNASLGEMRRALTPRDIGVPDGFALECRAMRRVRDEMGLRDVKLMVPFCRTVEGGDA